MFHEGFYVDMRWNSDVRTALSDIDGDVAAHAMTIASTDPGKRQILIMSTNLHRKADPAPTCDHRNHSRMDKSPASRAGKWQPGFVSPHRGRSLALSAWTIAMLRPAPQMRRILASK